MRFPVIVDTRSRGGSDIREPEHEVLERGDVVEATVGEWRAVEALGRREPADLAVQTVVVVVANEALQRGLGAAERAEDFAIEDLALERRPERLDLAIGPGRVHLGLDLADLQFAQRLAEAVEHAGHPVHELGAAVAHQVQRPTAQLDAVAQPHQDRGDLASGRNAQAQDVAGVVVDQAVDPGLEVTLALELDEERTFDVDVPERIDAVALVARATLARSGRPARAEVIEELLDPAVADRGDLAPAQLGRDALGVPVRVQPNRDDDLLEPCRVLRRGSPRTVPLGDERGEAAGRVGLLPAPQRHARAPAKIERRCEALVTSDPQHPRALPHRAQPRAWQVPLRRATTAGRQEAKAWSFLVRVTEPAPVGVAQLGGVVGEDLVHLRDASCAVSDTTGNLN